MKDLTKMNVTKALLIIAIPTMISSLLQFSYNIIDMYYVGLYDRTGSLIASIGSASLFIGFAMGINFLSVLGSGIKTSQALGQKNQEDFESYATTGLYINLAIALLLTFVLFVFAEPFISLLGLNEDEVVKNAVLYLKIYSFALFFNFFNAYHTRIMSSMGMSGDTLKINSVGIALNMILDPIFIFVFDLGLFGACLATVISNAVVTVLFTFKNRKYYSYNINLFDKAKSLTILNLSYPYVIQRIIFSIVGMVMGKVMIYAGDSSAIAGQRLGLQIESVTLMVVGGLLASTSAFTGQNYGAKEYERIKQGFNKALQIGICYSIFTGIIFIVFGNQIIGLFTDDAQTIYYGSSYIKLVALTQVFSVFEMVGNGLYNGISKPKVPTVISIAITPLRIPFAFLFLPSMGANGVFVAIILTTVIKGIISYGYYLMKVKPKLSNAELIL